MPWKRKSPGVPWKTMVNGKLQEPSVAGPFVLLTKGSAAFCDSNVTTVETD